MKKYDYFMKEKLYAAINKTFELIDNTNCEKDYVDTYATFERLQCCIDKKSYNKLDEFIRKKITPVVYEENFYDYDYIKSKLTPKVFREFTNEADEFLKKIMYCDCFLYKEFKEFADLNFGPILRNE